MEITPSIHASIIKKQPPFMLKEKIGLTQMLILEMLYMKGECRMSDIAKALGVTKSAITGITDRIFSAGIIKRERSRTDRRVVNIHLSAKGKSISKRSVDFKAKLISIMFAKLTTAERAQYLNIIKKIIAPVTDSKGLSGCPSS